MQQKESQLQPSKVGSVQVPVQSIRGRNGLGRNPATPGRASGNSHPPTATEAPGPSAACHPVGSDSDHQNEAVPEPVGVADHQDCRAGPVGAGAGDVRGLLLRTALLRCPQYVLDEFYAPVALHQGTSSGVKSGLGGSTTNFSFASAWGK